MSSIKITKKPSKDAIKASQRITAAEGDFEEMDDFELDDATESDGLVDAVDDVADQVEDIQDSVDDMEEEDSAIEMNNNISNHYIAECEKCHGVFISAVIESDQEIDHVSGVCPLCNKESDQYLKWIIKDNK